MTRKTWRDQFRAREGYWFVPKLFGLGATPVTWQGWLLTAVFAAALIAEVRLVPDDTAKVVIGIALVAVFIPIVIGKTDGGWRWRWGPGD